MRLLITGATGFVGRNLVLGALRENKYTEICLPVRSESKIREQFKAEGFSELPPNVRLIVGDASAWDMSGAGRFDHVVHSAGVIFARTESEYADTNVDGTIRLLRSLNDPGRVVILSSQSASGFCPPGKVCKLETDTDEPLTWYGKSKLKMEQRVREEFPHLNYVTLRPPMIFGPRDQATLPLFKMAKRPFHFKPGFKTKYYSYIGVNDLVEAIFAALNGDEATRGKHYFVAANVPISDRELIALSAAASGKSGLMIPIPQWILKGVSSVVDSIPTWRATIPSLSADRAKEIWPDRWVVSSSEFQKAFGWTPKEELGPLLRQTHDWYVKVGQLASV